MTDEAPPPLDHRYPYTYAADLIRGIPDGGASFPKLSRAEASRIRSVVAAILNIPDRDVATKLADYYLKNGVEPCAGSIPPHPGTRKPTVPTSPRRNAQHGDELRIGARVHSDDGRYDIPFDCTAWFEQASDKEILQLGAHDWRGGEPGDRVALFFEDDHVGIANMLIFCRASQGSGAPIGFECRVDADSALAWILTHRPSVAKSLEPIAVAAPAPRVPRSVA